MNVIALFQALEISQSTKAKRQALVQFIQQAERLESAFALSALRGEKTAERIPTRLLKQAGYQHCQPNPWLFDECYAAVGDLSETLAILLSDTSIQSDCEQPVIGDWARLIQQVRSANEADALDLLIANLQQFSRDACFLFLKLSTGGFRVGVSRHLVHDAIAAVTSVDRSVIDERLMGPFPLTAKWLQGLSAPLTNQEQMAKPLPFLLAHPWQTELQNTVPLSELQIEYKWDGIRCQLIKTEQWIRLWSRGDHDVTAQFPEIVEQGTRLPNGVVLDGEILIQHGQQLGSFQDLQTRLNRKRIDTPLLTRYPAIFRPYDCLRLNGDDLRSQPLTTRRAALETLPITASPVLAVRDWEHLHALRATAAEHGAEGLMIKWHHGTYEGGRKSGLWWKWKLDPLTADCILIYAQAGHGRRASIHSDFTLAVSNGEALVPIAKAYSGLTDAELKEIDQWIRRHTIDKFGPVRHVTPELVFEIGFEGIARSRRHKSGIALRFPRILRWRRDLRVEDADTLASFEALLANRL
jgi:DNA ligase 1